MQSCRPLPAHTSHPAQLSRVPAPPYFATRYGVLGATKNEANWSPSTRLQVFLRGQIGLSISAGNACPTNHEQSQYPNVSAGGDPGLRAGAKWSTLIPRKPGAWLDQNKEV